jgi:hypothetical protein
MSNFVCLGVKEKEVRLTLTVEFVILRYMARPMGECRIPNCLKAVLEMKDSRSTHSSSQDIEVLGPTV